MFSKVPSCAFSGFWTLTLKLTQHFDLIYNIGKSDWKILRNIMKTAQDIYTITTVLISQNGTDFSSVAGLR